MAIALTDPAGTIAFVNEKFCEQSGYGREQLLGQSICLLNAGQHSAHFFEQLWDTILAGNLWHGELCNRAEDGRLYWVECFIIPELDEEGQPRKFWTFQHDISLQKEHEYKVQQLIDTIDNAFIWMIDREYRLMMANQHLQDRLRKIFEVEEVKGFSLLSLPMSDERRQLWKSWYDRALAGESFTQEIYLPEIGSTMLAFFSPVRSQSRQVEGVNICQLNIDREKKKQQHILRQQELLLEIAHLQSHKIRGPLSTMLGLISLLDKDSLTKHNREIVNHLLLACRQLDRMVHAIVEKTSSLQPKEDELLRQ